MSGATATAIAVGVASAAAGAITSKVIAGKPKTPNFPTPEKVIDPNIARKATSKLETQNKAAALETRFAGNKRGESFGGDSNVAPTRKAKLLGGSAVAQ